MSDTLSNQVATEIRVGLARKRATQQDLAKAVKMAPATLTRRLAGDGSFTLDQLVKIANFLDVPPAALVPAMAASA